ncbi:methylenetetrahydrofolate reductase [Campylobacter sp. JMF_06 NA1]|uniref:methylenetetrahydrofolate reductase n=1 Tax=Campylobacter sp. JMF_06 NA1 TaxID=2983823 RepID=UPI0022E9B719|nr:methylenetetrahydrofolate reductase [Campylobacter sp. JMF_06 NA1]MDA3078768.1 methylenetetrahydrofolate reductase [Campylobacter sp. JMF_06 NA1]
MLEQKIKNNASGILLYGIVPPKISFEPEKIERLGALWRERITSMPCDGIVIYDLQDESARTSEARTYEFIETLDPALYYTKHLHEVKPAIIYRAVGKYDEDKFGEILNTRASNFGVFVGASSKYDAMKIPLKRAYQIKKEIASDLHLGGICIAERHKQTRSEHLKIASKSISGCEYFISQAVYDAESVKNFIDDYANLGCKKVPIIFTFTPCGSEKTLEFMKWLGISVPDFLENRLKTSADILQSSVSLCVELFDFIYKYSLAKGISVGANVESVSTKKAEIEASIELLKKIKEIIVKRENLGIGEK